jgi:CRP/FNR family cyclic AMP-dependent transcriptional regulator
VTTDSKRLAVLGQVPLFRGLSSADLERLSLSLNERLMRAGDAIFALGDAGGSLYIVLSGRATIFLAGEEGGKQKRVVLRELAQGDHFGELALFDDQPRSASVECAESGVLLELTRAGFLSDVVKSKDAMLAVLREMAHRLRDTNLILSSHVAKDAVREMQDSLRWPERLADRVAELNGSWTFILVTIALAVFWAAANAFLPRPFDGYPYTFFNLILGLVVALQGPLIMMSQNRQSNADRAQAANNFRVNLKNEMGIEQLLREQGQLREEMDRLSAKSNETKS